MSGFNSNTQGQSLPTYLCKVDKIDVGDIKLGIAVQDAAVGEIYIMYSQAVVQTRWPGMHVDTSEHLTPVRYNGTSWEYDDNFNWVAFTPVATDHLVGVYDTTNHIGGFLTEQRTVHGISGGICDTDMVIYPETWQGLPNPGEVTFDGTYFTTTPGSKYFLIEGTSNYENIDDDTDIQTLSQLMASGYTTCVSRKIPSIDYIDETPTPFVCPGPMTRSALIALRSAGSLDVSCHYIITDPSAQTNLQAQTIEMHAVDANTLSMNVSIKTAHHNSAWSGIYDIDGNDVIQVMDHQENVVSGDSAVNSFPWGQALVSGNKVDTATINYTGGTVLRNELKNNAVLTVNSGRVLRNQISQASNVTVTNGDFIENNVLGDSNVVVTTPGDVDGNIFSGVSSTVVSGGSLDNSVIDQDANLSITGGGAVNSLFSQSSTTTINNGTFAECTVTGDSNVTINNASNYENTFKDSVNFTQTGTGYIRYSTLGGNTSMSIGDTNISGITAHSSALNTTGSTGSISNTIMHSFSGSGLQNIPSLTITASTLGNNSSINATGATRVYIYRSTVTDAGRVIVGAGSRVDANYANIRSYGYIQSSASGGVLTVNYTDVSGLGYIRNQTANSHSVQRSNVSSSATVRFEGTATNCRVYYSNSISGGSILINGTSSACYVYYCTASDAGQIILTDATSARYYYSKATTYGFLRTFGTGPGVSNFYYCTAEDRGYVEHLDLTARMRYYSISARCQSIARGTATTNSNFYYSRFSAYFYLYGTFTGGTRTGLFGDGRHSATKTNPTPTTPHANGSSWNNIL